MTEQSFINQMEPWYGDEEIEAINNYLKEGGWLMEFKKTQELEKIIANFVGSKYCSILPNGTISLFLALKALNIGIGDEVIVPDYTMIATPNAVVWSGATPVFVDIDDSMCLDIERVRDAITDRTRAVMHVSINGRAGELINLKKLCEEKGLFLIEDAAQSLGSFFAGKHLGTYGHIGSFSFSVPKIITMGQGGALVTDDRHLYEKICKIKDFGRITSGVDIHDEMGWNFKYTDLQAVFGIEQMKKLDCRIIRKKEIAKLYHELLSGVVEVKFIPTNLDMVAPWFFEILVPNPTELKEYLKTQNIGSRLFYPAVHTQKIYKWVKGDFPQAIDFAAHGLWLPSASQLANSQIEYVCARIIEFYHK
ncbi:aminotransferase [Candidatus Falkowbacteria bacterium CG10_big_fil_rev_8_21_14_0_10_37_14]|uniref:Aminotransferase n=1 Tax=Candidatus Falkowbacteria bacterium CG10_big_fil_rev_8_21_14_0_10_37_14 TaxID=1974561 RepID=A0A2M6WTR4_9BACT|nr:DegT/DnrJ/EryC1/StrS family aminotransferase [Candidatus Falkowbacteria bacterium]PIT96184.1 MAG: aminotransferase [Candidatus Falkowbacteria bacterium CG10_big_fil_rev_8_21_14_0_10_37_14]